MTLETYFARRWDDRSATRAQAQRLHDAFIAGQCCAPTGIRGVRHAG
ncbi:hypothetical protein [Modicisalibacter radicis]|nr:hypothetical protein [Halomonas sp. EAR18]